MRFVQLDAAGEIVGWGDAGPEHFEAAEKRGERLVEIPNDAPHTPEELKTYLAERDKT